MLEPKREREETEPDDGAGEEAGAETLDELTAQAEQYLENWKRAEADLINFKKKTDQERQGVSAFANAMLVSSLLPILDDMERAFDSLDANLAGLTWVEGLKLVYRKLQSTLESQGLTVITTVGERFDPTQHEAVMQAEGEDGVVVGELQKGYRFHDRVIRPAMVKVGDGTPAEKEA